MDGNYGNNSSSGSGGGTGGTGTANSGSSGNTAGIGTNAGAGNDGDNGQDPAATINRLNQQLSAARSEAAKERVEAKQKAAQEAVGLVVGNLRTAAGLPEDVTDPQLLAQHLTENARTARSTAQELAVWKAATAAGVDAERLLDSRKFTTALAGIDPTDADAVTAAIQEAVNTTPGLLTAAGPARSGIEFGGAPTGGIGIAEFQSMSFQQRQALYRTDPETYRRLSAGT